RVIRPIGHTATFNGQGERFANAPWGIFGGDAGARGSFTLVDANGDARTLPIKPSGVSLSESSVVVIETPGAGGYGPPAERAPVALEEDARSGKFSRQFLSSSYGFVPNQKTSNRRS